MEELGVSSSLEAHTIRPPRACLAAIMPKARGALDTHTLCAPPRRHHCHALQATRPQLMRALMECAAAAAGPGSRIDWTARPTLEYIVSLTMSLIKHKDYKQDDWRTVRGGHEAARVGRTCRGGWIFCCLLCKLSCVGAAGCGI
eukprot:309831-Chlamydomonas_euryale.AAC.3